MTRKNEMPDELLPLIKAGIKISKNDFLTNDSGQVVKLKLVRKGITNISWLANMTELKELVLTSNHINVIEPLQTLNKLTHLRLSSNLISDIEPLQGLTNLTHLTLLMNHIIDIEPLRELYNLKQLGLSINNIEKIDALSNLTRLVGLDVAKNNVSNIESLSELKNIKSLHLSDNNIRYTEPIKELTKLSLLDLSNNKIVEIDPLCGLNNLLSLYLFSNKIESIEPLSEFINLNTLSLHSNRISDINPLVKLHSLEKLYIDGNNIKDLQSLKELKQLKELSLSSNQINNIQPLSSLNNLVELNLTDNQINNLEPLRNLINLNKLFLSQNQIAFLDPLRNLKKLRELYLSTNKINSLYPLQNLNELTFLDIYNNKINDILPIVGLSGIDHVNIYDNPCAKDIPAETISAGWQAIIEWLNTKSKHEMIYQAKMLLLGNPNVGKSDLLYYLENNKNKPKEQERNATHGLEYRELTTIDREWKIHCWDFGGQEYYHATHQLFFSPGALHLLLWSARDEQRKADLSDTFFKPDYWLRCIEQLSQGEGNIETITIENKIDIDLTEQEKKEQKYIYRLLNREEYTKEFPNLELNTVKVSLQDGKRIEGLKELVKERLSVLFRKHPPKYVALLTKIQSSEKSVLTIAEIADAEDHDYVKTAMTVLHNIGCILYFNNIIPEKVFVKPKALLELLYERILNKEKTESISFEGLKETIKGNELGLSVNEVRTLLLSFHLIFTIPDELDKYYIPQYLPAEPSWMELLGRLHFRKSYVRIKSDTYIMHDALLRIFTEYGRCIKKGEGKSSLFWKDGLVIEKDGQVLLIKFNRTEQCIDLYSDIEDANLALQKEIIKFILNLKTDGWQGKRATNGNRTLDKDNPIMANIEVWHSKYFDVLVSSDGKYFASLRDILSHIDNKSYHVEAYAYNGDKKEVSVFNFNKYLPNNKQGKMKKIFISYSKSDLELVNKFIEHLAALKLDGKVATWYCTELTPGSIWNAEIQQHFDEADIICFMISPNFMRTKYIHEHEIDRAFKKREKDSKIGKNFLLVPIILDFCRWKTDKNDLTQFCALPYTAKPVVDFANQNMAWYLVEECLRLIIEKNEQPEDDDYFEKYLPEDVKRLFERIVKGGINAGNSKIES